MVVDPTIHELLDRLEEKVDLVLAALLELQAFKVEAPPADHYQDEMRRG